MRYLGDGKHEIHFVSYVPHRLSPKIISVCLCFDYDLSHEDRCGILSNQDSAQKIVHVRAFQVLDFQVRNAQAVTSELARSLALS